MKKLTLRLPEELHLEAESYAQKIGLSLNGLALVALADYLRDRARNERELAQEIEPEMPPDFWEGHYQEAPVIQPQSRKRHKSKGRSGL